MKTLLVILSFIAVSLFPLFSGVEDQGIDAYPNSAEISSHSLTEVGVWGYGPCDTVYVEGSRAYIGSGRYLIVLDISDKSKPKKIGEIMLGGYVQKIYVSAGYAYVANAYKGLRIINVSNPGALKETGCYNTTGSTHGLYVSGNYAYVADFESGLRVITVSHPYLIYEVGFYDTPG